mmetsp:Transcript_32941/g.59632  ORF Transcript_32941/g.59632 Transcript_32941/m.59632 type:complete len:221 (+) Transcript_32941:286-948(+)
MLRPHILLITITITILIIHHLIITRAGKMVNIQLKPQCILHRLSPFLILLQVHLPLHIHLRLRNLPFPLPTHPMFLKLPPRSRRDRHLHRQPHPLLIPLARPNRKQQQLLLTITAPITTRTHITIISSIITAQAKHSPELPTPLPTTNIPRPVTALLPRAPAPLLRHTPPSRLTPQLPERLPRRTLCLQVPLPLLTTLEPLSRLPRLLVAERQAQVPLRP